MEHMMKKIFLLLAVLLLSQQIFGQQQNWKTFNQDNTGFPLSGYTKDIYVSPNSDIWLGSGVGLTEFDGIHWINQNESNSEIPFVMIKNIFERNGKLYFSGYDTVRTATNTIENEERFAVYYNGNWTEYNLKPHFTVSNNNQIQDFLIDTEENIFCTSNSRNFYQIFPDSVHQITNPNDQYWHGDVLEQANDGGIWISRNSTDGYGNNFTGIYKYLNGQIDSIYFPIPADTINVIVDMQEDSNGNLWLLGYGRLVKFDGSNFSVFKVFTDVLGQYFAESNLEIDSENNLWFGSKTNGLYKFNSQTLQFSNFDIANPFLASGFFTNDNIRRVKFLSNNQIYLLGDLALYLFDGNSVIKRWGTDNTGIAGNNISSVFIDAHKHIWTSDLNDGFAVYNGDKWNTYSPMDIFNRRVLTLHDICVTPAGDIWLADDSLRYFTNNSWHSTSLPSTYDSYSSVTFDQNNKIWIGSNYGGLFEYENENFKHISNSEIMGSQVNKIFVDKNNNKWVGFVNSGISKFDGTTWTHFNSNDGLPGDNIIDIAEDNLGNIWVSIWTNGIAKYDGSVWTSYTTANSGIPTNATRAIACDYNDAVWVGTEDSGLVKFEGGNWTVYNSLNSPISTSATVTDIAIDGNNNKWIGTGINTGLFVYNENGVVVDVKDNTKKTELPNKFILSQNYPNPFNPSTKIKYSIPSIVGNGHAHSTTNVILKIYDILGEEITTLVNKKQTPGNYEVKFNAGNLSSGLYFYRLKAGNFSKTNKMILLK